MKSLLKIYRRYILTACLIIFLLIVVNIVISFGILLHYLTKYNDGDMAMGSIRQIAATAIYEKTENKDTPMIPLEGIELMEQNHYIFAMILSPRGDVLWQWQCPEVLPTHYTAGDIASFSKWYLMDYPVKVWRMDDYLLVCGNDKESFWKYPIELPRDLMDNLGRYVKMNISINLFIILSIIIFMGYRFYKSLNPITNSIEKLADGSSIILPEKGVVSELNKKLNQTSLILENQQQALNKRDNARTEWIASVSHDIRTPLSMIMGYADELTSNAELEEEQHKQADIIKHQSIKIKTLIDDLNLTSKLEYHMQPLNMEEFMLAPFLRNIVVSYLNDGLEEKYDITLNIEATMECAYMHGDKKLLTRAINNLINNCMQHNEVGCHIEISAAPLNKAVCSIVVRDNGKGISESVVANLLKEIQEKVPHIMGLRIVKQIICAHEGNFYISHDRHAVVMELPLKQQEEV